MLGSHFCNSEACFYHYYYIVMAAWYFLVPFLVTLTLTWLAQVQKQNVKNTLLNY